MRLFERTFLTFMARYVQPADYQQLPHMPPFSVRNMAFCPIKDDLLPPKRWHIEKAPTPTPALSSSNYRHDISSSLPSGGLGWVLNYFVFLSFPFFNQLFTVPFDKVRCVSEMQNKSSFPSLLFCTSLNLNKILTLTKVKTVFLLLRLTEILQYLCTR